MKRRRVYSGTFKAKVVCELIKGNKSLNELAEQYQVHPNQIKNWKSILLKNASTILEDKRKRIKDDDIDQIRNL
jgi:transposase-like protein